MRSVWDRRARLQTSVVFRIILLASVVSSLSVLGRAQAGQLDPTFGHAGIFSNNFNSTCTATAVAVQSDGKIVAGGSIGNLGAVVRLNTNGTLDRSFGVGGVVTIRFRDVQNVTTGVAIQSDGKILAVGTGLPQGGQLIRLETNGSFDASFGTNGSAFLGVTPGPLALQPDGKIVVVGGIAGTGPAMQRFENTGTLDPSFGSGGTAPLLASANSVALQSDGKIVLSSSPVTRYNANGRLDTTFGTRGQAVTLPNAFLAIAVQSDGRLITSGNIVNAVTLGANSMGFGLERYTSMGTVDLTFGARGAVITGFANSPLTSANALIFQSNGDIVAAGEAGTNVNNQAFALARYLSNGMLDMTFGTGGRVVTSFGNNTVASISAITLQSDGKIVVVGGVSPGNFVVARYLPQ